MQAALGLGLGLPFLKLAAAADDDPKKARPREGDRFVFVSGKRKGGIAGPKELFRKILSLIDDLRRRPAPA
jgi:hypothetical protein